jgi:glycosyltransferase involved in cell wall biosynthesis
MGKPILCISNGEASNFVYRTQSGLVSRNRDPQKIAELVMKLINDKTLADQLGSNGYNFIHENLTLEKIGERFIEVIESKCL